jgi:hypothetical protein
MMLIDEAFCNDICAGASSIAVSEQQAVAFKDLAEKATSRHLSLLAPF